MKELYTKFIERYGIKGVASLIFFPIVVTLTTPIRFFRALYSSRVLLSGQWQKYNRFNAHRGINSLFYWTQALNIERFGRNGVSPLLADGKFELSNWFHLTLFSTHSYWKFGGAVVPIIGLFGWLFFHFLWVNYVAPKIVLLIIITVMLSSTFYANMFEMQNYNALGWMFFPIGIYGIYTGNWWIETLGWLLVSFTGFTALFVAGIVSFMLSIVNKSFFPILAILPALIKISFHFLPLIKNIESIQNVLKIIGGIKKEVRYKRKTSSFQNIRLIYYIVIYIIFIITMYFTYNKISISFFILFLLFIANESGFFRFADPGSLHMPIISIAAVSTLLNFNIYLFLSFLLLVNAPAIFLDFTDKCLVVVPKRKPFLIEKYISMIEEFVDSISHKGRVVKVLFAFEDPNNEYGKIFDGYRVLMELFYYVCCKKNINLFPDWYFIWKYNYPGAPDCWGRDINSCKRNMEQWKADYLMMYEKANENIIHNFAKDFIVISKLEIKDKELLKITNEKLKIYLLERKLASK